MNPSLRSDCCGAPPEAGVSAYTGYGMCSRCKDTAVFEAALGRGFREDRKAGFAGGLMWAICLTLALFAVVAFPVLPAWGLGLAAIVSTIAGLSGWRINRKETL